MKCPKCHYLSFEPSPRCRNCGFDLGIPDVDVAIPSAPEPTAPAADLELHPRRRSPARRAPKTLGLIHPARETDAPGERAAAVAVAVPDVPLRIELEPRPNPVPSVPQVVSAAGPAAPRPQTPGELPLFVKGLLSGPSRPPLAVRRAAPELVRPKPAPTPPRPPGPFDADLMEDLTRLDREETSRLRAAPRAQAPAGQAAGVVGPMTRLAALGADWAILSAVSTMILWASLRVADAGVEDLGLPAVVPLAAFLVLVGFGYFLMFTLGTGQTPGKMAMHIRVVDATAPASQPPSPRQALNRTLLAAASGMLFGIGFLPALGEGGLAAPDRFAQTRTVRV
jgi:uncharacterized RDD family membrane protein YckC